MNLKAKYDKASLIKDISERKQLIDEYRLTGYLNREKAISKIQELRITDPDVCVATNFRLAASRTPFDQATNEAIAAELQMQIDILSAKSAKLL